jgi:hypothetical protein
MRLNAMPEFESFDLLLIHNWLAKRDWIKTTDHPLRYEKNTEIGTLVAQNIFDALKLSIDEDLAQ